jgi:hypothetical protein
MHTVATRKESVSLFFFEAAMLTVTRYITTQNALTGTSGGLFWTE